MPLTAYRDASRTATTATLRCRRLRTLHAARLHLGRLGSLGLRLLGGFHVLRIGIGDTVERVFLLRIAEDVLAEGLQLLFDALLLSGELRGVAIAELQERLTLGVVIFILL